jgi:hypothetical protein
MAAPPITTLDDIRDALHGVPIDIILTPPPVQFWPEPCGECPDQPEPWQPTDAVARVWHEIPGSYRCDTPVCVDHLRHVVLDEQRHHDRHVWIDIPTGGA